MSLKQQSFIKPVFPGYYKLHCFPFYQTAFPVVQPLALLNLDQHLEINAVSRKKTDDWIILVMLEKSTWGYNFFTPNFHYFSEKMTFSLKWPTERRVLIEAPIATLMDTSFSEKTVKTADIHKATNGFPTKYSQTPLYVHPLHMDTSLLWTLLWPFYGVHINRVWPDMSEKLTDDILMNCH